MTDFSQSQMNSSANWNRFSGNSSDIQDLEVDLRNFLLMLWRRKLIIISVMMIALSVVFIFVNYVQPRFTAKALVMIESKFDPSPEIRALISNIRVDTTLVLSEAEILKSRMLARKVIEKLDLISDPEFNPSLAVKTDPFGHPVYEDGLEGNVNQSGFKSFSVNAETNNLPPEVLDPKIGLAVDRFLNNIYARPIPGSFVLQVEFTHVNPKRAAEITNTIIDSYIEQRLETKFQATKKVSDWLDRRLESLREQVRISEAAVEQYRAENNLTIGARSEVTAQQLSELNSQLVVAKSNLAEATARREQAQQWLKNPQKIEATSEVLNSRLIQNLKLQESEIMRKISDLSNRYGDRHPNIINARTELEDLQSTLGLEIQKIIKGLDNELKVAQARVDALEDGLDSLEGLKHVENQANIRLRELVREAESNRLIFDTFLETYKRSDQQEQLQEAEARVISYATVPRGASYPNKPLFLSLTAAASFFLGIALSLLLEKLDNTFRTSAQLEAYTQYPCFGTIPEAEGRKKGPIGNYIIEKPASAVAESVRTLRMVLNLRSNDPESRPRVITVTSSLPGEGKTTLSSWMGRLIAKSGERVLVIDCDLRRPNLHNALGKKNDTSLVDYLIDQAKLEDVVKKDEQTGLHYILARSVPNNALDLITSEKMRKLIDSCREVYDLVILDSPACLAVSDSRILATQSDQTLFTVGWDSTPKEVVSAGVKQFSDFGYERLAFVLTNVDIKRHAKYGYGDTVYYYGRYKEYYKD